MRFKKLGRGFPKSRVVTWRFQPKPESAHVLKCLSVLLLRYLFVYFLGALTNFADAANRERADLFFG